MLIGHISQVVGPVVDVVFRLEGDSMQLPSIHEALEVLRPNGKKLILEIQQKTLCVRLQWILPTACVEVLRLKQWGNLFQCLLVNK